MRPFWFLSVIIQIYLIVHVLKTGRERWWIFVILLFPGLGSLIYFLVEYLPDMRHTRQGKNTKNLLGKMVPSSYKLRQLKDQLELSDNLKNRQALAEGYVQAGHYQDAITLYQSCLQGIYANDPYIREGLCRAYFLAGDLSAAKACFVEIKKVSGHKPSQELKLLWARALEDSGETEKALKEYDELVKEFLGDEARCRYALLLKKTGRSEAADKIFQEIIKNARLSPKFYRRAQKKWIDIAKKEYSGN